MDTLWNNALLTTLHLRLVAMQPCYTLVPVQASMHAIVHLHLTCTCRYFFNLYITTVLFSLL